MNGLEIRKSHKFAILVVDDVRSLRDHKLDVEDLPDGANTAHALVVGVNADNAQSVALALSLLPMEIADVHPDWIVKSKAK